MRAARAFALLNMAMHDAAVGCWDAKFTYYNPRPVADGSAHQDNHRPAELPVLYVGPLDVLGGGGEVLSYLFPAARSRFDAQKEEAAISRLYGGIHYRADIQIGKEHGSRIGGYTVSFARTDGADLPH